MASLIGDIREVLTSWSAPDREQERLRVDFLALAHSSPDAAFRSNAPDHITASTLVFSCDLQQVALLFHPKFDRWLQMGGHCEPTDSSLHAAASREAQEECGIADLLVDPEPVCLSRHRVKCWPNGHHLDVQFAAVAPEGAILECSAESTELRWFDLTEIPRICDKSVISLLAAAQQRLSNSH